MVRRVPTGEYVPPGIRSLGVPDLLLCRQDIASDLVAAVVNVLATDAPQLVPPYVRGLQYLAAPTMIQTGLIPCIRAASASTARCTAERQSVDRARKSALGNHPLPRRIAQSDHEVSSKIGGELVKGHVDVGRS